MTMNVTIVDMLISVNYFYNNNDCYCWCNVSIYIIYIKAWTCKLDNVSEHLNLPIDILATRTFFCKLVLSLM